MFIVAFILAGVLIAGGSIVLYLRRKDRGQITTSSGAPVHIDAKYLPVLVLMNPELARFDAAVAEAVRFWNKEIGRVVLVYGGHAAPEEWAAAERTPGVVYINVEAGDVHTHAKLSVDAQGRILAGPISLRPDVLEDRVVRVLVHELGHSPFGLDHDDAPSSPMYPHALPEPYVLSEADRTRLRALYG